MAKKTNNGSPKNVSEANEAQRITCTRPARASRSQRLKKKKGKPKRLG